MAKQRKPRRRQARGVEVLTPEQIASGRPTAEALSEAVNQLLPLAERQDNGNILVPVADVERALGHTLHPHAQAALLEACKGAGWQVATADLPQGAVFVFHTTGKDAQNEEAD